MKLFLKKFFALLLACLLYTHTDYIYANAATMNHMSVHNMFKDVDQDDLLSMMAEGQEFIKYLETNGTPEEKMAFAQAMEETLQNFTEEDWREFEAIVETVQDKLPPLFEPIEKETVHPLEEKAIPVKATPIDNTLEKILIAIHKTINAILLKAKSDKILAERIAMKWDNRDNFNEMVRLLQALNKKELIAQLMASKEEADKQLLESIQNFNTRLQTENDQFIIADTFGLQIDEATTASNLKKLNIIIDFFDRAIASLLPKLIKFMQAYEPLALKIAEKHDKEAKNALDHATKVEKHKKPYQALPSNNYDTVPKKHNYEPNHANNYNHGASNSPKEHPRSYLEDVHLNNIKNIPQLKKDSSTKTNENTKSDKSGNKTDNKKSEYDKLIDNIDIYFETFSNKDVANYTNTINKTQDIFQPFGKPIDEKHTIKAQELQAQRATTPLKADDESFLNNHTQQYKAAIDNFEKNIKKANSIYTQIQEDIENINPQINEMQSIIGKIKGLIDQLSLEELEKLNNSTLFKNLGNRINTYHNQLKSAQRELKNKHKLHRLEHENPRVALDYDSLEDKINSLHGLDRKISEVRSQLDALHKSIKARTTRLKRDKNKKS